MWLYWNDSLWTCVLLLVPCFAAFVESANRLNDYISHYEEVHYNKEELHSAHQRAKRSVTTDHRIHFSFNALGKNFRLRLKRDLNVLSDAVDIVDTNGNSLNVDRSHLYEGDLIDEPGSEVFATVNRGVMSGTIRTKRDGTYYVENAGFYFAHEHHPDRQFPSVIYHENDIDMDPHGRETTSDSGHAGRGFCGINATISEWMERIQNSAVDDDDDDDESQPGIPESLVKRSKDNTLPLEYNKNYTANHSRNDSPNGRQKKTTQHARKNVNFANANDVNHNHPHTAWNMYSRSANEGDRARSKRSAKQDDNRNTCSLSIQTDPLLWRYIRKTLANQYNQNESKLDNDTREEIVSMVAHHVIAVNYIYQNTKFDGKYQHRNIKFEVQRIKIDDDSSCGLSASSALGSSSSHKAGAATKSTSSPIFYTHNQWPHQQSGGSAAAAAPTTFDAAGTPMNPFCNKNIDVSNFLNMHSLGNHEDFCLAYVFTYRDFTGGTLGLAWVASASGASGGICEKYKTYTETSGGTYHSSKRSLNTGVITFVNYDSRVPLKVSQLTLAHEIGHNFGSPHDYPQLCRPGGHGGNYIMFASATNGDQPNNSIFSNCSVGNVSQVLDAIHENNKRNCFKVSNGAFCGNKIVEQSEECDCGFDESECNDRCCYPRWTRDTSVDHKTACKRPRNSSCSPSQGPCCDPNNCDFVAAAQQLVCRLADDCSQQSTCDGTSALCPTPSPRPDKTVCNNGTQVCQKGVCTGSICLVWNLEPCSLSTQENAAIDKRKLCELACIDNVTNKCRSTSDMAHQLRLPSGGISLRPGSPCNNFQGYCDVFLKCRAVDADGPLVRLVNSLFNKQSLQSVTQWITDFWWAVLLMGIAFLILMGLFIKCCAVHTPSSNPKKPPARRITETLRRPMNTLRRMRHQQHQHQRGGASGAATAASSSAVHHPPHARSNGGHRRSGGYHGGRGEHGGGSSNRHDMPPRGGYGEGRGHYNHPPNVDYCALATAPPPTVSNHSGGGQRYSGGGGGGSHSEAYAGAYEMRQKV